MADKPSTFAALCLVSCAREVVSVSWLLLFVYYFSCVCTLFYLCLQGCFIAANSLSYHVYKESRAHKNGV